MTAFEIYEEGFHVMEGQGKAHLLGIGYGDTFEEACEEYIKRNKYGEKREYGDGTVIFCNWGCRWFSSLAEAQKSYG